MPNIPRKNAESAPSLYGKLRSAISRMLGATRSETRQDVAATLSFEVLERRDMRSGFGVIIDAPDAHDHASIDDIDHVVDHIAGLHHTIGSDTSSDHGAPHVYDVDPANIDLLFNHLGSAFSESAQADVVHDWLQVRSEVADLLQTEHDLSDHASSMLPILREAMHALEEAQESYDTHGDGLSAQQDALHGIVERMQPLIHRAQDALSNKGIMVHHISTLPDGFDESANDAVDLLVTSFQHRRELNVDDTHVFSELVPLIVDYGRAFGAYGEACEEYNAAHAQLDEAQHGVDEAISAIDSVFAQWGPVETRIDAIEHDIMEKLETAEEQSRFEHVDFSSLEDGVHRDYIHLSLPELGPVMAWSGSQTHVTIHDAELLGNDGTDDLSLQFLDGPRFIHSVTLQHLWGEKETSLRMQLNGQNTSYDVTDTGEVIIDQEVETLTLLAPRDYRGAYAIANIAIDNSVAERAALQATEHPTMADFSGFGDQQLVDFSTLHHPVLGEIQLHSGAGAGLALHDGALRGSADGSDHVILEFEGGAQHVNSVSVHNLLRATGDTLLNIQGFKDGQKVFEVSVHDSTRDIKIEKELDAISFLVGRNSKFEITDITVPHDASQALLSTAGSGSSLNLGAAMAGLSPEQFLAQLGDQLPTDDRYPVHLPTTMEFDGPTNNAMNATLAGSTFAALLKQDSSLAGPTASEVLEAFFHRFPEWNPENRANLMAQKHWDNYTYNTEFESQSSHFVRVALQDYQQHLAERSVHAVDYVLAAIHGDATAMHSLRHLLDQSGTPLTELGLKIATSDQLINDAYKAVMDDWGDLADAIAYQRNTLHGLQQAQWEGAYAGSTIIDTSQTPDPDAERAAAHQAQLIAQAQSGTSGTAGIVAHRDGNGTIVVTTQTAIVTSATTTDGQVGGVEMHENTQSDSTSDGLVDLHDMTSEQMLNEAESWYDPFVSVGTNPDGTQGRYDSVVGRLYLGLMQQMDLHQGDTAAQHRMAAITEAVTGIAADQILFAIRRDGSVDHFTLQKLFESHGFGEIFVSTQSRDVHSSAFLSAVTDSALYTDPNHAVHISFDAVTAGKQLDTIKVYNGDEFLVGTRNRAYIDVPISTLAMSAEHMKLNVVISFTDGTHISMETNEFGVAVTGAAINDNFTLSYDPETILGSEWNDLSLEQQSTLSQAFNFGDLKNLPKNKVLIQWLMDNYIESGTMQFDASTESWNGSPITDPNDAKVGECKWWVDDVVSQHSPLELDLPSNVPNPDGLGDYQWGDSHRTLETVLQSVNSGISKDAFATIIKAGDFVQIAGPSVAPQHTFIVGSVTNDGAWVFDANYGLPKTPRYHFISFKTLEFGVNAFTVYRAQ